MKHTLPAGFYENCNYMARTRLPVSDKEGLNKALADANIPTLLMVYVHFTHDRDYLEQFRPYLQSIFTTAAPDLPAELTDDLRARLFELLTRPEPPPDRTPDRELVRHMMSVGVGQEVDEDLIPALYDQMGFDKPPARKDRPGRPQPPEGFRVLVIGAGMTGIAAGIKLGEAGYEYTIIEKNAEVGGTWWENVYPGVGVDTPSHFYSYSFEQNPDWSHYHPKGPEIQDYLIRVASKYGVRERVVFDTRVVSCNWDEKRSVWLVKTISNGEENTLVANAIINGHGVLNRWSMPDIPGLAEFSGPVMHTAGWDRTVSVSGKRVALVGTGASGAQVAVAVAAQAEHLTVFQRSRHWVMNNPEINLDVTEGVKFALREIPHYQEWFRFRVYWFSGDGLYGNVLRDPGWPNQELSISAQNEAAREYAEGYMKAKFADRPDLVQKMLPDYPIFGKRIVLDADGGWLDTLQRPNVTLETGSIDHVEQDAIVLDDGTRVEADIIVLATGFDLTPALGSLQVFGRDGVEAGATWGEDARAYLGILAPRYPNFFMVLGPNSSPNHAAGVNMVIEAQVNYIVETLDLMVARGARAIEPSIDAFQQWNDRVDEQMKQMVWTHPKCNSYYLNSERRNWVSCPFRLADYWSITRHPQEQDLLLR